MSKKLSNDDKKDLLCRLMGSGLSSIISTIVFFLVILSAGVSPVDALIISSIIGLAVSIILFIYFCCCVPRDVTIDVFNCLFPNCYNSSNDNSIDNTIGNTVDVAPDVEAGQSNIRHETNTDAALPSTTESTQYVDLSADTGDKSSNKYFGFLHSILPATNTCEKTALQQSGNGLKYMGYS